MSRSQKQCNFILNSHIDALSWEDTIQQITTWSSTNESRYICICNVHSVVTAKNEPDLQTAINNADMATPDGFPIAWTLRRMGHKNQERINGPDLMWKLCEYSNNQTLNIFLYGSTTKTLDKLKLCLSNRFPKIQIVGSYSPPFRTLTVEEDDEIINLINSSGAQVVFVGLGCPKQELWMAKQRGKINATMIGVGAAFDYHAGTLKRAPIWMRELGVEWLYRLAMEPGRLWKRYLMTNTVFIYETALFFLKRTSKH